MQKGVPDSKIKHVLRNAVSLEDIELVSLVLSYFDDIPVDEEYQYDLLYHKYHRYKSWSERIESYSWLDKMNWFFFDRERYDREYKFYKDGLEKIKVIAALLKEKGLVYPKLDKLIYQNSMN